MHRSFPRLLVLTICFLLCLGTTLPRAADAVEFGWKELPGGGIEYQVQVEPELIPTFEKEGFSSEIPPGLRDIRSIRITTGRVTLPNQGDLQGPTVAPATTPTTADPNKFGQSSPPRELDPSIVRTAATGPAQLLDPNGGSQSTNRVDTFNPTNAPENSVQPNATNVSPPLTTPVDPSKVWSGFGTYASPTSSPAATATVKDDPQDRSGGFGANSSDSSRKPEIGPNDGPHTENKEVLPQAEQSKPWMPLMLALLALFASLAANVYLVWLHQEIRFKYFSLLRRLPDGSVA